MLVSATKKKLTRRYAKALFMSFWTIIFIMPVYAGIVSFPAGGNLGDIVYTAGRTFGLFGLFFLSYVISSLVLLNPLKKFMDPLRLHRSIMIVEVLGITWIIHHPLALVLGRYLLGYLNPLEILIPNFSSNFYLFVAQGCVAFWMIFIAGMVYLNRNSVRFNKLWSYVHVLLYPAFFLSLFHGYAIGSSMLNPVISGFILLIYYTVILSMIYKMIDIMVLKRRELLRKRSL
jgi:hypothetical protein